MVVISLPDSPSERSWFLRVLGECFDGESCNCCKCVLVAQEEAISGHSIRVVVAVVGVVSMVWLLL